jgi:hypothetical protein
MARRNRPAFKADGFSLHSAATGVRLRRFSASEQSIFGFKTASLGNARKGERRIKIGKTVRKTFGFSPPATIIFLMPKRSKSSAVSLRLIPMKTERRRAGKNPLAETFD